MSDLSERAGVTGSELRAVLGGAVPRPPLLQRLAPALDLHTADLFVIAGTAVPDELAPFDTKAGNQIPSLAGYAMALPPDHVQQLRRLAQSLPRHNRIQPSPPLLAHEQYQPSHGAVLMGMLGNRNLNWTASAKTLYHLTGRLLAAATIGAIGHGRKEVTPDLLADFATLLGVPAHDLAALTGIEPLDQTPPQNPAAANVAELIWDIRHLTADQVQHISDKAKNLQQA
ncbi:hypothetical protein KPP03845_107445 [Streptomyces xanthophaeus]|uniref:hypothetical protein n=1 Tax=Streptomyces xanthophaeus TaxID=67385 RepID=UPI00233EB057|nr:hypothetical protein [Streptomyces xanthophaeus]WCD91016.1 hypothetical protein KPP03845_107445 [Streptomyces xanthophaeus]